MYIDIPANDNLAEPVIATFKETGPGRPLRAVRLWRHGVWRWCAVTACDDDDAPVAAEITPIEESGDGPALLVHGGAHGLRLAEIAGPDAAAAVRWSIDDAAQWAEPFLICRPGTDVA